MAFCVMNVDKQGRAAVYGLQIEANREKDDKHEFDLSDIDRERTDQNYYLKKTESWNREITRQIKAAGVKERSNSVVMITGVYTASPEWFENHTREEMEKYFQDCLAFHVKEYCQGKEERLLNAVVHLDETTPHMQVASSALVTDEKGQHLSARTIMGNRSTYRLRQDRFYEEVGKKYDLERGERRDPAQTKEHTTKREWQLAKQEEQLQDTLEKTLEAQKDLENTNKELEQAKEIIGPQIEAYNVISKGAKKRQKPTIETDSKEVKDGLIRTHDEYFVKIPCKDEKEAKQMQKEVTALYDKGFAEQALNELILSKNKDLKKRENKLKEEQEKFEQQKNKTIANLETVKDQLVRQMELYNEVTISDIGITQKDIKDLAKDSVAEKLIEETVKYTLDILESRNYLKKRPDMLTERNIIKAIQKSFAEKIHEFIDKVREHITEKLFRKAQTKDLDLPDNLVK